jgi:hypothetical protein
MNVKAPDHYFEIAIVIPCYKEKDPINVLNSLSECLCDHPESIGIWMVFNYPEGDAREAIDVTLSGYKTIFEQSRDSRHIFCMLVENMPSKKAGVGLARKTGMDEAVKYLYPEGLLVNLDADCEVSENYLQSLLDFKRGKIQYQGASLRFEHPYPSSPELKNAIILYELHLRYYIQAQRWLGLPYAFHTIGSAMAVRAGAYIRSGGMNTRKAGEDFYFLQKIIQAGSFSEINETVIYPSPRISDRVPFGTGRAVMETLESGRYKHTYPVECFYLLVPFFKTIKTAISNDQYDKVLEERILDPILEEFLNSNNFSAKWEEIWKHTRQKSTRLKRFYQWWDAFLLMKWCHFCRECIGSAPVNEAALTLLNKCDLQFTETYQADKLLERYRQIQQEGFHKLN